MAELKPAPFQPTLIVVPPALIDNWLNEIDRFKGLFSILLYHGSYDTGSDCDPLCQGYIINTKDLIKRLEALNTNVPSFIEKEGEDPKDGEDLSPESDDRLGVGSGSGGGQGGMLPPVIEATEDTQPDSAPQAPHRKPAFLTPESSRHEVLAFFREYADFMNVLPVMEIGFNKATDGISLYRYNREQMIDVVGDRYLGMKIYDDLQCCRYAKNHGSKKTP
ncbi:hypothetical protein FQN53_000683 [Emmonsiellopsis sp. PD_33]|nr:hypothetical protein FQN53_000683 [Emmonsiellopsis sp. PD_33]